MIVAKYLLVILHAVIQVFACLGILATAFRENLLAIFLIPIAFVLIRFYFELITVIFSINNNLSDIKDELSKK